MEGGVLSGWPGARRRFVNPSQGATEERCPHLPVLGERRYHPAVALTDWESELKWANLRIAP